MDTHLCTDHGYQEVAEARATLRKVIEDAKKVLE